jgi:predicted ArsR family transcriptional regulator
VKVLATKGVKPSEEAAERIQPKAPSIREQVLAYIKSHPGTTCEEATQGLKLKHQSCSPRFLELVEAKLIEYDELRGPDGRTLRRYRIAGDPHQQRLF